MGGIKWVAGNEILQHEITGTQTSFSTTFGGKLSFIPYFLNASTDATYIFTDPSCIITIITLEPCALNDLGNPLVNSTLSFSIPY